MSIFNRKSKPQSSQFLFDQNDWQDDKPVENTPFTDEKPTSKHFIKAFVKFCINCQWGNHCGSCGCCK